MHVSSHYMGLVSGPCNMDWINEMPVLQAVLENTTIKRVVELSLWGLEVSVAVIVGLLIGGQVSHYHGELWAREVQ